MSSLRREGLSQTKVDVSTDEAARDLLPLGVHLIGSDGLIQPAD